MNRRIRIPFSAFAAILVACGCNPGFENFQTGTRLGLVRIYRPEARQDAFVFLFSDADDWNERLDRAAAMLTSRGAVVVGVRLPQYLERLAASPDGCHYLISELEYASKKLQRDFDFERYRSPILAGAGQGATLAYAALAQAPAATVEGAVSIDPTTVLMTQVPLCAGAHPHAAGSGGFSYDGFANLPGRWSVSAVGEDGPAWRKRAEQSGGSARFVQTEGTLESRMTALVEDLLPHAVDEAGDRVRALPLIEHPARGDSATLLIFYSGDGGWRDLDKQIAGIVAQRGVPVIGIDSLRYFWRAKTPTEIADDLAAIFRAYAPRWHLTRLALAGYSFGADILPFAYNRLPSEIRTAVTQVSLLGVERTALFEFKLGAWLVDTAGQPVLPELQRLPMQIVQCFYGEEEKATLCRSSEVADAEVIATSGSHHFDGNYAAIAERMLDGLARRARTPASTADHAP